MFTTSSYLHKIHMTCNRAVLAQDYQMDNCCLMSKILAQNLLLITFCDYVPAKRGMLHWVKECKNVVIPQNSSETNFYSRKDPHIQRYLFRWREE